MTGWPPLGTGTPERQLRHCSSSSCGTTARLDYILAARTDQFTWVHIQRAGDPAQNGHAGGHDSPLD